MIQVLLSNQSKTRRDFLGTVYDSRLANYQEPLCRLEFLKPRIALEFLRNKDGLKSFNDNGSVGYFLMKLPQSLIYCFFNTIALVKLDVKMI